MLSLERISRNALSCSNVLSYAGKGVCGQTHFDVDMAEYTIHSSGRGLDIKDSLSIPITSDLSPCCFFLLRNSPFLCSLHTSRLDQGRCTSKLLDRCVKHLSWRKRPNRRGVDWRLSAVLVLALSTWRPQRFKGQWMAGVYFIQTSVRASGLLYNDVQVMYKWRTLLRETLI